ncbi:MAG TPA: circadian clock KaiB family protein [Gammaproteobacteria bacterium]|nr:circadian clock KaiB family protein [Gammaproteobacteria bacterium]
MDDEYLLRLYIAGKTPRSDRAIAELEQLCVEELGGRYRVEVIDIKENPTAGKNAEILATPTVVKQLPLPVRRVIGDLSETEKVLIGLDLVPVRRN